MTVGVGIASYGEINFVVIGVVLQLISVMTESTRLTLVQILLQVSSQAYEGSQKADCCVKLGISPLCCVEACSCGTRYALQMAVPLNGRARSADGSQTLTETLS